MLAEGTGGNGSTSCGGSRSPRSVISVLLPVVAPGHRPAALAACPRGHDPGSRRRVNHPGGVKTPARAGPSAEAGDALLGVVDLEVRGRLGTQAVGQVDS